MGEESGNSNEEIQVECNQIGAKIGILRRALSNISQHRKNMTEMVYKTLGQDYILQIEGLANRLSDTIKYHQNILK